MKWFADAPSNIALIKYMGKTDVTQNIPTNPSLSYTLNHLKSFVELEVAKTTTWEPLQSSDAKFASLNKSQQQKFLDHLGRIKSHFNFSGDFTVRSANTFPTGTGLASSASSFAALTLVACKAISDLSQTSLPSPQIMSSISQKGSGSSCRSFFSPWSLWDEQGAHEFQCAYPSLIHHVIVISEKPKQVSSSEAHKRVLSSPLFEGRTQRAQSRLMMLTDALKQKYWSKAYQITWDEFEDMHALFQTSSPAFHYIDVTSRNILNNLQAHWSQQQDGPLITLDAGPNIHLLFRENQHDMIQHIKKALKGNAYVI